MKTIQVKKLAGAVLILTTAMNGWSYSINAEEVGAAQARHLKDLSLNCGGSQVSTLSGNAISALTVTNSCVQPSKAQAMKTGQAIKTKSGISFERFDAAWIVELTDPHQASNNSGIAQASPNAAVPIAVDDFVAALSRGDVDLKNTDGSTFWALLHDKLTRQWRLARVDELLPVASGPGGASASPPALPEPGSVTLLAAGMLGLMMTRRYSKRDGNS